MNLPDLIGIGGTFASGKDTFADYLVKEFCYEHISTSDMVRAVAIERYGSVERPILQKVGIELRNEDGSGALAKKALKISARPAIISGIRTVAEVRTIKDAGGVMVFIDADQKVRYDRMKKRARDNESELSLEEFMAREERERDNSDASSQNLSAVEREADVVLDNSGELNEFLSRAVVELSNCK